MSLKVNILKDFKSFKLDINFDLDYNCIGILGESGSGKSMILKCIAGIETPDKGFISLNGRVLFDSNKGINIPTKDRNIGYLFQNYALFPNMNAEDNIKIAFKTKDYKDKLKYLIQLLKLENILNLKPYQLSGGQQQRVALARMLAMDPEIMFFDEPFSAIDYSLKHELQLDLYNIIKKSGKKSLMVTHSRDEIYRFCDYIVVICDGKIVTKEITSKLFENPKDILTAKLIGIKNIFKVDIISKDSVKIKGSEVILKGVFEKNTNYIGIKSHDISPIKTNIDDNEIKVVVENILEEPFEKMVILNLINNSNEKIRLIWLVSVYQWKDEYREIDRVFIKSSVIKNLNF